MPSVGKASNQVIALSFMVNPRLVKLRKGSVKKITLAAVPTCPNSVPKAELLATMKNHKKKFTYSRQLKGLLKKLQLTIADLEPVRTYLKTQLKQSRKQPEMPIGLLHTYLKKGIVPNFTVEFKPQNPPQLDMSSLPVIVAAASYTSL